MLKATAEVGHMAANAANPERITATCRRGILEAANTGIRCMMLAALAVQNRVHSNPTLASTVDAISGLGASIGIS